MSLRPSGATIGSMRLIIIRHAQSANNALEDQSVRVAEPHLTEVGEQQAEYLAQALAESGLRDPKLRDGARQFDRLFSSPMLRALQTAAPLSRTLELPVEVWVDIHECGGMWQDHGQHDGIIGYPGLTAAEMAAAFPGYIIPPQVTAAGWWNRGQEQAHECRARTARVVARLRSWAGSEDRIVMISHGDFANNLIQALLDASAPVWIHMYNTGVSVVDFRPDGTLGLRFVNRVDHLPEGLVT